MECMIDDMDGNSIETRLLMADDWSSLFVKIEGTYEEVRMKYYHHPYVP